MPLPNDFRALGKSPMPPPRQGGSPMQVSGSKLQENFEYLDKFPSGAVAGDMLYFDGNRWELLSSPETPPTGYVNVMQYNRGPQWYRYKELNVSICEDGTPASYIILGIPTA